MIDPATYALVSRNTPQDGPLVVATFSETSTYVWETLYQANGRGRLYYLKAGYRDSNAQNKIRITIDGILLFAEAAFGSATTNYFLQNMLAYSGGVGPGIARLDFQFAQSLKIEGYRQGGGNTSTTIWLTLR